MSLFPGENDGAGVICVNLSPATDRVPVEIWGIIIDFLLGIGGKRYPLLFVNSLIHGQAERSLYRRISLQGYCSFQCRPRLRLFERLVEQPRLAHLVEWFSHNTFTAQDISSYGLVLGGQYFTSLNLALRSMANLRHLTFYIPSFPHRIYDIILPHLYPDFDRILDGCSSRLKYLNIPYFRPEGLPGLEKHQTEIEHLALFSSQGGQFSRNAFPKLRVLVLIIVASETAVSSMLSFDRPIVALWCASGSKEVRASGLRGGPFHNLRSLRVFFYDTSNTFTLATMFPALHYLRLDLSQQVRTYSYQVARVFLISLLCPSPCPMVLQGYSRC